MTTILVVEDDADVRESTALALERRGYVVITAVDGKDALSVLDEQRVDLAVVDVAMPVMDGIMFTRAVRAKLPLPVIMLTARALTGDVVSGLEAGADDYVTKPFDTDVLVARIEAVLRRFPQSAVISVSPGVRIDTATATVTYNEEEISLTSIEYKLLIALAEASPAAMSRQDILTQVWGNSQWSDTHLVDVNVQRLRQKIGPDAIRTVRGKGYSVETARAH